MKYTLLIGLSLITSLHAQNLTSTVQEVLSTNPIILERLKNYNSIKEDITSAESGYYPKLDLVLGAGHESTDRTNRPASGANESFDFSVYQNSLTLTQNLFSGFETTYQVQQQENKAVSAAYSYVEKVNDTAFSMVNSYIQVMKNTQLLQTAQENVDINDEIFQKVKKLFDAGLTTLSEVNKIESSLSLSKSNYIVQENTLMDSTYSLQRILGRYINPTEMSEPIFGSELPSTLEEATQYAMQNNPSLLVSKYNIKLAKAAYKEKKAPFYPKLDLEVSQSMNKNLSAAEGNEEKFRAMAFLKYNFFNGFSDTAALQKSISQIHQENQSKNNLRRQVIEGMNLSWASNQKLSQQLVHLKDYQKFSEKTLTLYSKEYDLGRRSLLDLLSAQNDLIGSKSQIITTKYSMLFAKYRILDAMGTLVASVLNDASIVYSNVGLTGSKKQEKDSLPIKLDGDNDLIVDDKDICSNSLSSQMKNIYGCKTILENTLQVERYSEFTFSGSESELSSHGEDRLQSLIKQLGNYGFENLKFDVLGNVDIESMDSKSLLLLSAQRAGVVKNMLIKAGANEENITIHAQSDNAPMYTNASNKGKRLNNRVDIVVRKQNKIK
ncbi:MAG: adhesin transport system outer membrane protein [Sulfurimonas sp.]|jgi:adhesin transport system outer membrane protein|uniref:TolC family outer membrane protein n=1 Tax=Sulfurimonas sp. TaxID=2022749 RepID=UPI0039E6E6E9